MLLNTKNTPIKLIVVELCRDLNREAFASQATLILYNAYFRNIEITPDSTYIKINAENDLKTILKKQIIECQKSTLEVQRDNVKTKISIESNDNGNYIIMTAHQTDDLRKYITLLLDLCSNIPIYKVKTKQIAS